jgi:two-component system, sensor histidine kinase and response regulator
VAQLFDEAELMERVDDDVEFLGDTVQMLESDGRALMVELKAAVASCDAPAIGRTAHTLKGMISNFCSPAVQGLAPAVQSLAFDVEKTGKAADVAGAAAASAKLEPELEALIVELVAFVRARS